MMMKDQKTILYGRKKMETVEKLGGWLSGRNSNHRPRGQPRSVPSTASPTLIGLNHRTLDRSWSLISTAPLLLISIDFL
uniref:Uncharacterized protein n=1 Tax=Panagrolaimus sp. JU765 TaxID=591449 RepID=A0AC34QD35_9BILA